MPGVSRKTEASALELYRIALQNVEAQPEIAEAMNAIGYDTQKISQGKALLASARTAYDQNKVEHDDSAEASSLFSSKKAQLDKLYKRHRSVAKVKFRKNAIVLSKLDIASALSKAYIQWIETIGKFYTTAITDTDIQATLAESKITVEELNAALSLLEEVKTAYSTYHREKGESQEATKAKDAAFALIHEWMSDFYAIARIALEDHPQLLEALGKKV